MLSLANVSAAHGANYFKVENYYSDKDSAGFSHWAGKDAHKYGLEGTVDHNRFSQLLKGTDADIVVAGKGPRRKRAGLDMTFSAPKSVSVQALVFGDSRLVEAHRTAVAEALEFAEKEFAVYRKGHRNDRTVCRGKGLLVAQFEHDSSRLKDPQLHTHNVVLNRIEDEKGQVRALHSDLIYKNSVFLGMIYQNSLAKQTRELGYQIKPNAKGSFEIEGFSKESLALFSKRKEQIELMNPESYRETRDLVLRNRKAKEGPQQREALRNGWEREAQENGILSAKSSSQNLQNTRHKSRQKTSPDQVVRQAIASVTTKSSVFCKEEILKESLQLSMGKFDLAELEASFASQKETLKTRHAGFFTTKGAVERDLRIRDVVEDGIGREVPLSDERSVNNRLAELQKLDVPQAKGVVAQSTEILLSNGVNKEQFEAFLRPLQKSIEEAKRIPLAELTQMRGSLAKVLQKECPKMNSSAKKTLLSAVMRPIERGFLAPTAGQIEAVSKTLLSKDKSILWQGVAGAGKTYALRQIVQEAQKNGVVVKGFAPSAAAAMQLSKETGIETETLQAHILKRESISNTKCLWIVDEAGMVSANDFRALQIKAEKHAARVLWVGDHRQLSPVDAGNPFLDIQRRTNTTCVHLNESLRQKDPLLQAAVAQMNRGDVSAGVQTLSESVQELKTPKGQTTRAAREFLENNPLGKEDILVLARTNKMRADLTAEIRTGLKKQGFLKNEILVPTLRKIDVSEERLAVASTYSPGDFLVPNRRYQMLGLAKDVPYEIVATNCPKNSVFVQSGANAIEIPLSKHSQFSLFSKSSLPVAEGDKMIWNRNVKSKAQMNNEGFVVEGISQEGILIRSHEGLTRIIDPKVPQHMEHAWTLTVYKAQGQTATQVLQVVDPGTTKRDLIVGVTRATDAVMLIAPTKEAVLKSAAFDPLKAIAAEQVLGSVHGPNFRTAVRRR